MSRIQGHSILIVRVPCIGGSTKFSGAPPPPRDPILSFSHTFSPKSARSTPLQRSPRLLYRKSWIRLSMASVFVEFLCLHILVPADSEETDTNKVPKHRKSQSPSRKSRKPFSSGPMKNALSSLSDSGQDSSTTVTSKGEMSPQIKQKSTKPRE